MRTISPTIVVRTVFSRLILSTLALLFVTCTNFAIADDEVPSGVFKTVGGPNSHKLGYSDRDVIVLIHGWNPVPEDIDDKFGSGKWPQLILALKSRLSGTSWNLQLFDWSHDAATGPILDSLIFGLDNAYVAAVNGQKNGPKLAEKIGDSAPYLRRLVVIAHSAGAWVARSAIEILLKESKNPYLTINLVLLDPFIPGQITGNPAGLTTTEMENLAGIAEGERLFRLENYYSRDIATDFAVRASSQTFKWMAFGQRHIDSVCVNSTFGSTCDYSFGWDEYGKYSGHDGPIQFYIDSILATQGPSPNAYITAPWFDPSNQYGFPKSLVLGGLFLPTITKQLHLSMPAAGNTVLYGIGAFGYVKPEDVVTLSVEVRRAESFQWYKNKQKLVCGTECTVNGSTLTIHSATKSDEGEYVVRIGNDEVYENGYTFSDKLDLQLIDDLRPIINTVTPRTLSGIALPETQKITINGSNFKNSSRLTFSDGFSTYSDIEPTFLSPTQLEYNIAVGDSQGIWTVLAANSGIQSAPYEFYVDSGPQPPNYSPKPDATDGESPDWVRLTWDFVSGVTSYDVYRCGETSQSTCLYIDSTPSAFYDDTGADFAKTYYYRLKACNENGCDDDFSQHDSGHRGSETPPPTSSIDASDGLYTNGVVVYWPPISGADYYQIQRARSLNGSQTMLSSNFTFTTYPDVSADPGLVYYYWVRSCTKSGICGAFGDPDTGYRATETPALQPATNPEPANNETGVSIHNDLSWENGGGATSYNVYFGTDPTPDSGELLGSTLGDRTEKGLPDLDYNTTYYWRVDPKVNGESITGVVWTFTTRGESAPDLPERPINPSPAYGERDIPRVGANLRWENGGGATSYDVYFGRQFEPGTEQFVGNTTSTSWSLPTLEYDRNYYWRVRGRNSAGTGKGDIWKFYAEPSAPDAVLWPHPIDGATAHQTASVRLNWTEASRRAIDFDVYFGTDPSPDNGELVGTTAANRSFWDVSNLELNTTYYWKIVSKNNAGETSSPTFSFTTWATAPGVLSVSKDGFSSFSLSGATFAPSSATYTIENIGEESLDYAVYSSYDWLELSQTNGTLAPHAEVLVTATINENSGKLVAGVNHDVIKFINVTNSRGNDSRAAHVTVEETVQGNNLIEMKTGHLAVIALTDDGKIFGWGANSKSGAKWGLGLELLPEVIPAPIQLWDDTDWVEIAAGFRDLFAIKSDGGLYAWGLNSSGQLGLGDTEPRGTPTQVGSDNDWESVSTGYSHTLALKKDGRLFSFGENDDGQLGLGDRVDRTIPEQVGIDSDWEYISADFQTQNSMAIKGNGELYVWGRRGPGETEDNMEPKRVGTDSNWKKVMIGGNGDHYIGIKTDGRLYGWGGNRHGQLGLGDFDERDVPKQIGTANDWVDFAVGGSHTIGLKSNGGLYTWGKNYFGELGTGDATDRSTPVLILENLDVVSIAATDASTHILLSDGTLYSWGRNQSSELGLGFLSSREYYPSKIDINWFVPPDSDYDGIPDTSDTDNDNDGVDDQFDAFPQDPYETVDTDADSVGNNADTDDDNDTLSDIYEITHGLDPLLSEDASLDLDGDGLSNLEEFQQGFDIAVDDVPPVLTIPSNVTVNSTGPTTPVDLGLATAVDFKDGTIIPSVNDSGPFIPGHNVITWSAADQSGNVATDQQIVDVIPMVSFTTSQSVDEGSGVTVSLSLNGSPIAYPVVVPFTVSGSADSSTDHDLIDGDVTIESPDTSATLNFSTIVDDVWEGDETVVITMDSPSNAVEGSMASHIVTIKGENIIPVVTLGIAQGEKPVTTINADGGMVTLTATIADPNPNDQHVLDWSQTNNNLVPTNGYNNGTFVFDPSLLTTGLYNVAVSATVDGQGQLTSITDSMLRVISTAPVLSAKNDSDGDGVSDLDEGAGDSDQDRIPDYLDSVDAANQLPSNDNDAVMQVDNGLKLRLGETAFASDVPAAQVTMQDLMDHGGSGGGVATNAEDNAYQFPSGVFDFEVSGTVPGDSVRVVIPQSSAVPANAVYRKYTSGTGWFDFSINAKNLVASAPGALGICPAPGDVSYINGLTEGHFCVQLTIEDGGDNDADNQANGVVKDPGGVAVQLIPVPVVGLAKTETSGTTFNSGDGEQVVFAFSLSSDSTDAEVHEFTVSASGEMDVTTDIDSVTLYRDDNKNGIPEAVERVAIGSINADNGDLSFALPQAYQLPVGDTHFLVTYQF